MSSVGTSTPPASQSPTMAATGNAGTAFGLQNKHGADMQSNGEAMSSIIGEVALHGANPSAMAPVTAQQEAAGSAPLAPSSQAPAYRETSTAQASGDTGTSSSLSPTAAARVAAVVAAAAARMSNRADDGGSLNVSESASLLGDHDVALTAAPEASTSKITLDDLRRRRIKNRQQKLDTIVKTHGQEMREIFFMMRRQDKLEAEGSPAMPAADDRFLMADDEERELVSFLTEYVLSKDASARSIGNLRLAPLNDARDAIIKDEPGLRKMALPIRPRPVSQPIKIENKTMPPPTAASDKVEAERVRRASLQSSKSVPSSVAPIVASATAASAENDAASAQISMLLNDTSEEAASLTSSATGLEKDAIQTEETVSLTGESLDTISTEPKTVTAAETDQDEAAPPATAVESAASTTDMQMEAAEVPTADTALSEVKPNARASDESESREAVKRPRVFKIHPPPSPTPETHLLPKTDTDTPLHPTLQVLSPNPLSVTYASSLRPLPTDPFRRFTGNGVGGGSIHHRSHRKAPQLPPKNGVPPPSGPVGAGGVDLYRWYVRARASPGAGLVGKADKCLLTTDWKVAFNEQRFIRAMDRIEKLKTEGLWSFRQIKKQKGPVVRKAHWDHLLDEVRWMQVDFREERRWKIAQAFHLASACKAWVKAKTPHARARLCVKTREPEYLDAAAIERVHMEANGRQENGEGADIDMIDSHAERDVKEEELTDDEEEVQHQAEVPSPAQGAVEMDALVDADADADADEDDADGDAEDDEDAPGEEDDADADADADGENDDGEVEAATMAFQTSEEKAAPPLEIVHEAREPAHMPDLSNALQDQPVRSGSQGQGADAQGIRGSAQAPETTLAGGDELPMSVLSTIRAPIFSMDNAATTVTPTTLLQHCDSDAIAGLLGVSVEELGDTLEGSISVSALFPELPMYDTPKAPDESGKGERRWDDGSLNQPPRLTHVSRLMDSKPLLVSVLNPAKNRVNGRWKDDSDWKIAAELSDPSKGVPPEDLDAPPIRGSVLFARKSHKAPRDTAHGSSGNIPPQAPPNADARAASLLWTSDEDDFLLLLIKQYGAHWQLISDLFNATRLSVPTDVREAWDCYDRYQRIQQAASEGKSAPSSSLVADRHGESAPNAQQAAAQALQANMPSNSLALKHERLTKKIGLKYDGSRKKLRRVNITEAMKRSAKRRETTQRAQNGPKRVNLQSHETHNLIKTPVVPTPQQLSMMKAERDEAFKRQQEMMIQQQRLQQQQQLQAQAQAQQAQAQAAQAAQANQGQGQGQAQAAPGLPAGSPPQGVQQPGQPLSQQQLAQRQHQQQLQAQQQRLMQQLQQQQQLQGRPMPGMPQKQTFPGQQQQGQAGQLGQASPVPQHQRPASAQGQQQQQQQRPPQGQFQRPSPQMQQQQARPSPSPQPQPQPQLPPGQQQANANNAGRAQSGTPRPAPAMPAGQMPGQQQQAMAMPQGNNIPPQLLAIQQSLQNNQNIQSSVTPETLQIIAMQLYRQAQQGNFNNTLATLQQQQQRPPGQPGRPVPGQAQQQQPGQQQARPPQQGRPQQQSRPQTPRPAAASTPQQASSPRPPSQARPPKQQTPRPQNRPPPGGQQQGAGTPGTTAAASTPGSKGSNSNTPAGTPRKT